MTFGTFCAIVSFKAFQRGAGVLGLKGYLILKILVKCCLLLTNLVNYGILEYYEARTGDSGAGA